MAFILKLFAEVISDSEFSLQSSSLSLDVEIHVRFVDFSTSIKSDLTNTVTIIPESNTTLKNCMSVYSDDLIKAVNILSW